MDVLIPSPLQSYTSAKRRVQASGSTLGELLADLDRRYPGIRFRMIDEQDRVRPHMMIYVRGERTRDMATPLAENEEVVIMQALSGG